MGEGAGENSPAPRPTASELIRGRELAQQTIALSFYETRGAVGMLEKESEGAIRAMFLSVFPDELAEQGAALASLIPIPGLAVLVATFGSGFHQGYSKALEHSAQGRNLHHELRAAQASRAPAPPAPPGQAAPVPPVVPPTTTAPASPRA